MPQKKTLLFCLCAVGVAALYWGVLQHFHQVALSDPDRYFHLALAKATAEQSLIRTLPQVEHLGWDRSFLEKNFLFTWLTSLGYQVQQEKGALLVGTLFTLLLSFAFCLALSEALPLLAAATLAVLPLASPEFGNRISVFRPHVLAIATFLLLYYGLLSRRRWLSFFGALLYTLSYHALYVPLSVLGLGTLVFIYKNHRSDNLKSEFLGNLSSAAMGMGAGLLLNPYFPQSLQSTINSIRMALNLAKVPELDRPIEIVPMATNAFLSDFGFYLLALILIWGFVAFRQKQVPTNTRAEENLFMTLSAATLFWFLALYSRRAVEYAIPLTLVLLSQTYQHLPHPKRVSALMGFLALLFFGRFACEYYTHPLQAGIDNRYILQALEEIPKDSAKKIFNCEWDNGAFILYARPKAHFIDITDPILLADHAPKDHALRTQLKAGAISDPYRLIHSYFKADYALCDHPMVVRQLEKDARFVRLYPKVPLPERERLPGYTSLYALVP